MATEERTIRPAAEWRPGGGDYEDIRYELAEGVAKITIDRPEVRNAFRPQTVIELSNALERAREDIDVHGPRREAVDEVAVPRVTLELIGPSPAPVKSTHK